MAKRSFQNPTWTTAALADTAAYSNGNHMTIAASAAAAGLLVSEIFIGGQAAASAVEIMMFARHSTIGVGPTALAAPASDGPLNTLSAAAQVGSVTYTAITPGTQPQRSAVTTSSRLNLSMNAFGGIVRWVAYPGEEWGIIGVTASISESSLSAFTGSAPALIGSHIIYEAY